MKHYLKIIFLLSVLMVMLPIHVAGQTYTNSIDYIFQNVDKSRIVTGLLSDYGVQPVELESFNGIPADSNYVDISTFQLLYNGLYSSKINANASLALPDTVTQRINNALVGSSIPLAMMYFKYNKLNDDAVNLGLLQIVDNQIIDIPGAASPYFTKELFAVAPLSTSFNSLTATFVFDQSLWYTNSNKTIQKLEVNFNNESGYLMTSWSTPISYTFSSDSIKTIYFKLTYTDGTSYVSQTNVMMKGSSRQQAPGYSSRATIPVAATEEHSGGTIEIAYSSSNTTGVLKKPLIVAEGFDPSGVMPGVFNLDINDFLSTSSYRSFGTIGVPYASGTLLSYIDASQYDIVYVDNKYGMDDIRRNAKLFEYVIEWVNTHKSGTESNVVMGISMGGLVARYALRKMELEGKDHQTKKYISIDAPHKGANVPVGIQAAVRHLEGLDLKVFFITLLKSTDINSSLKGAIDLLNSKAARQMLMYQVTSDLGYDNDEHASFQAEYDEMGFPQKCQSVAITDGSGYGTKTFAPETPLLKVNESYNLKWWMDALLSITSSLFSYTNYPQLMINIIPGKSQVNASIVSNALPNNSEKTVYNGRVYIKKKLLWFIPVTIDITNVTLNSTSDMLAVDGAPGGLYDVNKFGLSSEMRKYVLQTQFCFIPTVSALGLSNWENLLGTPLNNANFYANGTSGFSDYYTPVSNEYHTRFNSSAAFLYGHLTADDTNLDVYIQNETISTDRYVEGNNIYVGNHVTASKPQGDVLINNNARLILKGKTVMLDAGVENSLGSSVEVQLK
jgi:hypothetical protein